METILTTSGLTKRYGQNAAVNNVSLTVNKGDIYGFVGLNGSGKTTFIRLVTSLIKPSSGSFTLFGESGKAGRTQQLRRLSSIVETPSVYLDASAYENLYTQCRVVGVEPAQIRDMSTALLGLVGLADTGSKHAANFSLGMRQRLGIAMALVGDPEFLLLDEPTNGLDPGGIIEIRELLQRLNREKGITILISSHILSELGKLATRYGFIHRGQLIQEISAEEMFAACSKKLLVQTDNLAGAAAVFSQKGISYQIQNATFELPGSITVSEVYALLGGAGINVLSAQTKTDDLEAYFMQLIGGRN